MSGFAERMIPEARLANLSGFVELFAQIVLEELDFRLEAVNILELALASRERRTRLRAVPASDPGPRRVERARDGDASRASGTPTRSRSIPGAVDGHKLTRLAIQSVLEQTMIYGVFHGDLHAGNVLIAPDGQFSLVDMGIVGRITAEQRASLVRFMIAFASDDIRGQIESMREFGAIGPDADIDAMVEDARGARRVAADGDPRRTDERELRGVRRRDRRRSSACSRGAGFVAPKELVLFFKNTLYLNGFAAALAPDLNLFDEIQPVFTYFTSKYAEAMSAMTNPAARVSASPVARLFDRVSKVYDTQLLQTLVYRPAQDLALDRLREHGAKRILDVGCGTGIFTTRMHDVLGAEVVGCDLSEQMLAQARESGRTAVRAGRGAM